MSIKKVIKKAYYNVKKIYKIMIGREPIIFKQISVQYANTGEKFGGWRIYPDAMKSNPLIYSGGIGRNINFDLAMIEKYDAEVFAFDPTPKSLSWIEEKDTPDELNVLPIGISGHDGEIEMSPPKNSNHVSFSRYKGVAESEKFKVMSIESIMDKYNHGHIDILKLDIEGEEYNVVKDMLDSGLEISQILIEFHHRFEGFDPDMTKNAISMMDERGYKVFYVSDTGKEISLVHVDYL